jgi:hypothetical protein
MNTDWNHFVAVIILFGLMYLLCNYMQNLALANKDWVNLKCNPLYMVITSISEQHDESLKNFKNCVNNV